MSREVTLVIAKDYMDYLTQLDRLRAAGMSDADLNRMTEIYLPEQLYPHHNAIVYVTKKAEQNPLWDRFKYATIGRNITFKPLDGP